MSTKPQIELFLENENGSQQVTYPFVESDHVLLSNGMDIDTMIRQDVSMPTVTHEDLGFKVGVGNQDVSSAIVDSSVSEMTIKGQTYQNILPEPSTHVLSNNKKMFKVNEGLDPNVEIVDGVSKSAILTGQTLVNLDGGTLYLKTDVNANLTEIINIPFKQNLIIGKKYLVIFNVSDNNLISTANVLDLRNSGSEAQTSVINIGSSKGIIKSIITAQIEANRFRFRCQGYSSGNTISLNNFLILEYQDGMENWDIPYFTGMQSVKMPVLKTVGKNLIGNLVYGNVSSQGVILDNKGKQRVRTDYIPISSTGAYRLSNHSDEIGSAIIFTFDENKNLIKNRGWNASHFNSQHTFSNEEKYIIIEMVHDLSNQIDIDLSKIKIQFEQNIQVTTYEPFKSNILTVNEDITLRSNGDVYDELNLLTGRLTQRIDENNEVLSQEVVKTVDLSSSGNWEKIILNGSENWSITPESLSNNALFIGGNTVPNNVQVNSNNVAQKVICDILTPFTQQQLCNKPNDNYGISLGWNDSNLCVRHKDFPLTNEGLTQWKQYLSQNPITVWYQTTNHKDSTQVKQPIFFKDGHIQLSSGADNSLIPTLDYQAKTSNSYVMDLMKTNTHYTMKAKSASGTFTIDGTSYNVGTNTTFTSPSSMTNKFLVMSNNANEEVMILEGDVTSKTIPYFKGIKSAFEGEDKIEVLSTGKNLFDGILLEGSLGDSSGAVVDSPLHKYTANYIRVSPNQSLYVSFTSVSGFTGYCKAYFYDSDKQFISDCNRNISSNYTSDVSRVFTVPNESRIAYMRFRFYSNSEEISQPKDLIVSCVTTEYEPYKSNVTKIPLLSPLRSLPNGVCDELIIDRENNKAKIIQRVGRVAFNGSQRADWATSYKGNNTMRFDFNSSLTGASSVITNTMVCDKFCGINDFNSDVEGIRRTGTALVLRVTYDKLTTHDSFGISRYLSQNPMTVYYELATPIITEIDLEGFPYVYKDGHIFLNGEIIPVTEIKYSINQSHQIEANNQDILRQEKKLTNLQKLVGEYVRVDYNSTLLSLQLELK